MLGPMRMSSKRWDGVLPLEDEVGINGAGGGTKRDDTSMKIVREGRTHKVVGRRERKRKLELGCTYPSKRTVPVC